VADSKVGRRTPRRNHFLFRLELFFPLAVLGDHGVSESSLWLVASAGVYGVPGHAPYPPRQSSDVRLDLTKPLEHGGTLTVGVGRRGISVGRAW
jgi:hypothetical protein